MSTEEMSSRERLMASIKGEEVDRTPWSPCLDGYFLGKIDQIEGFRRIGSDAMLRHIINFIGSAPFRVSAPLPGKKMPWTVNMKKSGDEYEVVYETPMDTLDERYKFNPESPNIPWTTKYRLQSVEDVKILTWMCKQAEFAPMSGFFEMTDKKIGDDGITTSSIMGTPILWLINSEASVDTFWYLYFDHTEEMEALFEAGHQMTLRMAKAAAEGPGDVIIQYENLSTQLVSPAIWDKYAPRWVNEVADVIHDAGKICLMHACGHLLDFGDRLSKVRIDGLVDIATTPTGSLPDLSTARKLWGPDKYILGGIDSTAQVDLEPEELKKHVREILEDIGDEKRIALGTNDAVPKNTTWEKLQAITDAVKEACK